MRAVVYVHLPHRGLSVKLDGQLRNRWRQHVARTAPRRPEIDQDKLEAVEDITVEIHCVESSVTGVFRGHMMFLALLWGASISCDGVCSRVQTAINDSHPLDALVMEHLTSAHHFSGLTWEPWQPAAHRHLSGQRKSRSSLMKSGLQRSTIGGTFVTRASRGDHAGLNLRYPRPSSSARAASACRKTWYSSAQS